jgi:hypothetical protein
MKGYKTALSRLADSVRTRWMTALWRQADLYNEIGNFG